MSYNKNIWQDSDYITTSDMNRIENDLEYLAGETGSSYTKTNWKNGDIVSASRLNNIEDGIEGIFNAIDLISTEAVLNDITPIDDNISITVNNNGKISATYRSNENLNIINTPGVVNQNTTAHTDIYKNETYQLDIQKSSSIIPTKSQQVAVQSGKFTTGDVVIEAIPNQYIVPSGKKSITQNGTNIDVTEYEKVDVQIPSDIENQDKVVTPTNSVQEITADSGYSGLGTVTVNAVPLGTAGTPIVNCNISNHSATITPSVTNTEGYIDSGTKTGDSVSVSASELVSGTKSITENGTGINVANYASVDVAVPSSGGKYVVTIHASQGTAAAVYYKGNAYSTDTVLQIDAGDFIRLSGNKKWVDDILVAENEDYDYTPAGNIDVYLNNVSPLINVTTKDYFVKVLVARLSNISEPLNLPDNITKIGDYAFYGWPNNNIDLLRFPLTLTEIGNYAFASSQISNLNIPNVVSIGVHAFQDCTNLALTSLPSGLTSIGSYAFKGCIALALTSLPSGITSIDSNAFQNSNTLALTSLPSGLTSIGSYAFNNCPALALTSLPSGLTSIASYCFAGCTNVTFTELPSSVTSIGTYAFQRCVRIITLRANGAITTIGSNAFTGVSSAPMMIEEVYFPNATLTSLATNTFGSITAANACQHLQVIDIGYTSALAANAFTNCYALSTLVLRKTDSVCSITTTSLNNTPMSGYGGGTGTVYVPSALISSYQTATNWSTLYNNGTVNFVAIEGSQYE